MIVDLFQKTRASSRRIKNPKEPAHTPVTVTCKTCGREWTAQQYGKNSYVCPECGTHGRIRCRERIRLTKPQLPQRNVGRSLKKTSHIGGGSAMPNKIHCCHLCQNPFKKQE